MINQIVPVTVEAEVKRLCSITHDVVDPPGDFKLEWLSRNCWAAVPVEGAMHFNKQDAHHLSQAMRMAGFKECLAIATEPLENFPLCYRVATSAEGLLDFSRVCCALYFVLMPETRNFGVLCTPEDYYIVAGPRSFVTIALGSAIEDSRKSFAEFAINEGWPADTRHQLISVARMYEPFNGIRCE
jgi:hypothetical protein